MTLTKLPVPGLFDPGKVGELRLIDYLDIQEQAAAWARQHDIRVAATDKLRVSLVLVDVQNTFCLPSGSLFISGQSGNAAVEDNIRLCKFIYENLGVISRISATMDTHLLMQIFHPYFWVGGAGNHPAPMTQISVDDVKAGVWKVNPACASVAEGNIVELQRHGLHYVETLSDQGKYPLTIWPFHGMLGGVGHALDASVEEALFFHAVARASQTDFQIKGGNPLTENYSPFSTEVDTYADGRPLGQRNTEFLRILLASDVTILTGQAKSHCLTSAIDDLLTDIKVKDPTLAQRVYLLEDCTSPVVVPGVVDCTAQADAAFDRFRDAGMNLVTTDTPIEDWPGITL